MFVYFLKQASLNEFEIYNKPLKFLVVKKVDPSIFSYLSLSTKTHGYTQKYS